MSTSIGTVKEILQRLVKQIPGNLRELPRQYFIHNLFSSEVTVDEHLELVKFMENIMLRARELDASDIEIGGHGCRGYIWLRIKGEKLPVREFGTFSRDETNILIQSLMVENQREFLFERLSCDFSYTIYKNEDTPLRYRYCAYFELGDLALNIRAVEAKIRPYKSYGFHPNVTRLMSLKYTKEGLILITGITGAGKSTTLEAIVDLNNRTIPAHIVIIARPVEYIHKSIKCIIRHREVGMDTRSFKDGAIEALRQDPDIIVIGEMRDPDTIMTALEAADSGHKVFSTLHTYSAVESIQRIIGEMPPLEQSRVRNRLADILRCVVSQRLVPGRDKNLLLAKEVMIMTPSIKAAIRNDHIEEIYQMISEGGKLGMQTLEQDLLRLYQANKITLETAMSYANNKRRMEQLLTMVK
ncbi:MAG: PilT/PilU family type 4a pilus ATPase [Calditrichaeota bacterium]|nr:MAG: PilT/PilU family type 4a pilus ATPase [Calditrichota bacterium]